RPATFCGPAPHALGSGGRKVFASRSPSQVSGVAGGLGFEPRLAESESAVLPLDDPPPASRRWAGKPAPQGVVRFYISRRDGLGRGAERGGMPPRPARQWAGLPPQPAVSRARLPIRRPAALDCRQEVPGVTTPQHNIGPVG